MVPIRLHADLVRREAEIGKVEDNLARTRLSPLFFLVIKVMILDWFHDYLLLFLCLASNFTSRPDGIVFFFSSSMTC